MAFTNLPPNLQDLFYSITDRVSKLETGPSMAQTWAESAQTTADSASSSASNAAAQATSAYNAALAASAQATAAQYTAGVAYSSANNKNTTNYAAYAPSPSSNNTNGSVPTTGDIWFVVNASTGYATDVYTYRSGSWGHSPLDGQSNVILNIDAGKLVAGTIIANVAMTNGSGTFYVDAAGNLTATSATVQGTIRGNSGYFTGTVNASSGSIGGWSLDTNRLYSGSSELNASTGGAVLGGVTVSNLTSNGTILTTGSNTINAGGSITAGGSATFGSGNLFEFLSSSGNVRVGATYGQSVSGRTMLVSSAGLYGTSASTERKKHKIKPYAIDKDALLQLEPVTFNYLEDIDEAQNPEYGFIAEDADRLGLYELVGYDKDGLPDYFAYEKLPVFLLQIIKDQEKRITELEAKLNS